MRVSVCVTVVWSAVGHLNLGKYDLKLHTHFSIIETNVYIMKNGNIFAKIMAKFSVNVFNENNILVNREILDQLTTLTPVVVDSFTQAYILLTWKQTEGGGLN